MSAFDIRNLPDPQVLPRTRRRRFSVSDKLRLLKEADQCSQYGQLGALLRREGIFSSTLASFRKQLEEGKLVLKNDPLRTERSKQNTAVRQQDKRKIEALQKENQKLKALVELQKKLSELLDLVSLESS
jgi:transposase